MSSIIRYWNDISLRLVADDHTGSPAPANQGGPTRTSRALAMIHLAMHDVVAILDGSFEPYVKPPATPDKPLALTEAVSYAVYTVALDLYPAHKATLEVALAHASISFPTAGSAMTNGKTFGEKVGKALLAKRATDHSDAFVPYKYKIEPGKHQPDPFSPGQQALGPEWGGVTPFTYEGKPHPGLANPPAVGDPNYVTAWTEVYSKGRDSITRTEPDTAMKGIFWGYDGAQKLGTPPRLYNQVVYALLEGRTLDLVDEVRLFTLVNVGMADAGIACWYWKYEHNYWRPIVGIRHAENPATPVGEVPSTAGVFSDPFWAPLGAPDTNGNRPRNFTPGFPAYPSGHSTFGATALGLVARFFGAGTEDEEFLFTSDEFNGVNRDSTNVPRPLLPRKLTLKVAIEENAKSRVYLGVHWIFDATEGVKLGEAIADLAYARFGSPVAKEQAKKSKAPAPAPMQQAIPGWREPHR